MVKGLDTFRNHFAGYEEQYVLIGGAACDIVFESNDASFRAYLPPLFNQEEVALMPKWLFSF